MRRALCTLVTLTALVIALPAAWADVPTSMNVQGRLTDAAGAPVAPGFKQFTFKIFDQEVGGIEIWPAAPGETQLIATNAAGLWTAAIGSVIPLPENVFLSPVRWLEVTVDDGVNTEVLPRVELLTGPYVFRAAKTQTTLELLGPDTMAFLGGVANDQGQLMTFSTRPGSDGLKNIMGGGLWGELDQYDEDGNMTASLNAGDVTGGYLNLQQEDGTAGLRLRGGNTGDGSTLNMYSAGGSNTITFDADLTGTAAAVLPVDAIHNAEILDEPGLAAGSQGGQLNIGTSYVTLASATATFPAAGFAVVIVESSFRAHTASTYLWCRIQEDGSTVLERDLWDAGDVDGWYDQRQTWVYTGDVSAGAHTYDLAVRQSSGTFDAAGAKVTVMYFPTNYGTVSPLAAVGASDGSANSPTAAQSAAVVDVEAERAASIAANQERIERELAEMRREIEVLREQTQNTPNGNRNLQGDQ